MGQIRFIEEEQLNRYKIKAAWYDFLSDQIQDAAKEIYGETYWNGISCIDVTEDMLRTIIEDLKKRRKKFWQR